MVSKDVGLVRRGIVQSQPVYKVVTNSDLIEGRGVRVVTGIFSSHGQAVLAAKGAGVMGTDAEVVMERLDVFEHTMTGERFVLGERVLAEFVNPQEIKKRALAKLTDEEKEALGL